MHYFHGIVAFFLFITWFIFYTDDPAINFFVSKRELAKIHHEKSETHKRIERFIPYAVIILKKKLLQKLYLLYKIFAFLRKFLRKKYCFRYKKKFL